MLAAEFIVWMVVLVGGLVGCGLLALVFEFVADHFEISPSADREEKS